MALVKLASSNAGRLARVVAGALIVGVGLFLVQGVIGLIVAAIGLVPVAAGVFDVCLFAPLSAAPFKGSEVRALAHRSTSR